ncbi:MAG: PspC domain-containing protein [Cyclobacteriaceae bacterium]|nr:PspC domain-containing protein [Cyclobacteriaceae bacterium]
MKKNISINISGIIFHIEEDGYDILRKYLDSINAYFSSFEDNSEILADIESRIAELFLSKLSEGKQVITKEDVSSLINTMGSVSDFKAAEEQENAGGAPSTKSSKEEKRSSSQSTTSKKLYRDQKRKILGGVCAGLAHYFNIDPVWPRLLFALLVLGSYGGLLLVYIILWILLPASTELEEEEEIKKMFRDPEKKVIGGVASGVSVFFGIDVTLVRILFVIFTVIGGIGFLTYIILWIALPEAKSITEKMQMQGEPVTLSNIESSVKKGLNEKDSEEESVLAKVILFPFRLIAMIINGVAKILGPIFSMSVEILRVGFGVLITMIGIILLFSLFFSAGAVLGIFSMGPELFWWNMDVKGLGLPIEAIRNTFPLWVLLTGFVMSIIPALFLALLGISVIVKRVIFKPIVGWSLFVLFFICLAILSFKIPQTIYAFREEGTVRQEEQYPVDGKTLVFKMNEVGLEDYDVSSLRIMGQDENTVKIVKRFEAQGPTRKAAIENAEMVTYQIVREDSIYTFDSNITFKDKAAFRAQRINIDVYVPYNQDIVIDEYLWDLIDNYGRHYYRNYNQNDTWRMTESGLECITCEKSNKPSKITNESELTDFESVELSGLFDVRIERGDNYSVEVIGSNGQKEHYHIYTENKTLVIDYDNDHETFFWENSLFEDDKITINITMPHLRDLEAKGAGKLKFRNFKESDVEIKLTGAVIADGKLDVSTLDIDITGASFLDLEGQGSFMEAKITGASGLRAYQYEVDRAIVDANGASSAKVNVNESLEISQSFASNVSHKGDARVIKNQ